MGEADQQAEAALDRAGDAAADRHRCPGDPLENHAHGIDSGVSPARLVSSAERYLERWGMTNRLKAPKVIPSAARHLLRATATSGRDQPRPARQPRLHRAPSRYLARRPAHPLLAGPRHGAAQFLRPPHRDRSRTGESHRHRARTAQARPAPAGAARAPGPRAAAARPRAPLPRPHGPHRPGHPRRPAPPDTGGGAAGQSGPGSAVPAGGGAAPGDRPSRWPGWRSPRSRCGTGAPG